ncbi:hypothetical protein NPIL_550321 [Nephila pilipes]|uniref:Uncharacterized protein n=1 Tax=Nephila pilipes TaxID=299642 RepID=A0A8X6NK86_NEPPI|nr:hypothetical protein NPIL_550321 [Nephila pilipes]
MRAISETTVKKRHLNFTPLIFIPSFVVIFQLTFTRAAPIISHDNLKWTYDQDSTRALRVTTLTSRLMKDMGIIFEDHCHRRPRPYDEEEEPSNDVHAQKGPYDEEVFHCLETTVKLLEIQEDCDAV